MLPSHRLPNKGHITLRNQFLWRRWLAYGEPELVPGIRGIALVVDQDAAPSERELQVEVSCLAVNRLPDDLTVLTQLGDRLQLRFLTTDILPDY